MDIPIPSNTRTLFWVMQCINVLSLPLLFPPLSVGSFFGTEVIMTSKYDYLYSIKQFVPDLILRIGFRSPLPLHAVNINAVPIYFPGVAVECILGTLQGLMLGIDLLGTLPNRTLSRPALPAVALLLYAGMCIAAFPLHCLKEIPMFDIESNAALTNVLFWVDTFCTSATPVVMFLSGLFECGYMSLENCRLACWMILPINGTLTALGILLPNRWIMLFMHIFFQTIFLTPLLFMTKVRVDSLRNCRDGFFYMKLAKVCSILFAYCAFAFASFLSYITGDNFCPLTSVFVGSRIGMVQYWAYSKLQSECQCVEKKGN
jgi:hypothetical protein